jgi:hypothetical protein
MQANLGAFSLALLCSEEIGEGSLTPTRLNAQKLPKLVAL